MMTEDELVELSAYLDDELDADAKTNVEARLASDPEARRTFERLAGADDYLSRTAETFGFPANIGKSYASPPAGHGRIVGPIAGVALAWALGRNQSSVEVWLAINLVALALIVITLAKMALLAPQGNPNPLTLQGSGTAA